MHDKIWFAQLLRGLAALIVMIHHQAILFWLFNPFVAAFAGIEPLAVVPDMPQLRLWKGCAVFGLTAGEFGVAVFFLISGFVIPFSLERIGWSSFLGQRCFRIYPVYAAGFGLTCLALGAYAVWQGRAWPVTWNEYFKTITLARDWFGIRNIDGISWTLEIEVKFYLLCAFLCTFTTLRSARALVFPVALLALSLYLTTDGLPLLSSHFKRAFHVLFVVGNAAPFLPFMLVGTCLWNHYRGHWQLAKTAVVIAVLLACSFWCHRFAPVQMMPPRSFLVSYGAALVLFVGCYVCRDRIPYARPLNWLANISYPLYVTHGVLGYLMLNLLCRVNCNPYLAIGATMSASLLLADVLHRLIENPGIRLGRWALRRNSGEVQILPLHQSNDVSTAKAA